MRFIVELLVCGWLTLAILGDAGVLSKLISAIGYIGNFYRFSIQASEQAIVTDTKKPPDAAASLYQLRITGRLRL
jgi:hypothetical protein